MLAQRAPQQWNAAAHALWQAGRRGEAVNAVLADINGHGARKPVEKVLQLAYYVFLCGDAAHAAAFLEAVLPEHPDHLELRRNLAVCLARSRQHERAVEHWQAYLARVPADYRALDSLAHCYSALGRFEAARRAGAGSLRLKDERHRTRKPGWRLPAGTPDGFAKQAHKRKVLCFSLWGSHPRYLRGALDNLLAAPVVYPGWTVRFHADDSVPQELLGALQALGADLRMEPAGQAEAERLAWRFKVADDPAVGRFLVRDVDALIGPREKAAVDEWLRGGCWFHVMRDWWTHTDLMLAGMWGGVAGVLPSLAGLLADYVPQEMVTQNVDQWFLRDRVWAHVRESCHVHDRCFDPPGAQRWPLPDPPGDAHVGQDVYAVQREAQAARLAPWIGRLACLRA